METNAYLIHGPLAVALALLLQYACRRFSRAVKPSQRLTCALAILALLSGIHAELLYVILDASGMLIAFRPAMAALILATLFAGCVIVLCHILRKKRNLSEAQKLELNAM